MPLVSLAELKDKGCPLCKELAKIVEERNGLWSPDAEEYLLANARRIEDDCAVVSPDDIETSVKWWKSYDQ